MIDVRIDALRSYWLEGGAAYYFGSIPLYKDMYIHLYVHAVNDV